MLLRIKPIFTLLIASIVFFFTAECSSFIVSSSKGGEGIWKGYYQLVFDRKIPAPEITDLLEDAGFSGIISENTEEVTVFSFEGPVKLPLTKLSNYFIENDPLYDPYLKGLKRYFTGTVGERVINVIYLPADSSPFKTYMKLRKALRVTGEWWNFINFQPIKKLLLLVIVILMETALFSLSKNNRKFFIINMFAWVFPLMYGGFSYVIIALSFQFCWQILVNQLIPVYIHYLNYRSFGEKGILKIKMAAYLNIVVFISVITIMHNEVSFLIPIISMFIQFSGTGIILGFIYLQHVNHAHRLFLPVHIKEKTKCIEFDEMYIAGIFFILLFIAPIFYRIPVMEKEIRIAAPVNLIKNNDLSYSGLKNLFLLKSEESLPDLSDYVAHRAYLEGYMYGMKYTFPDENIPITISVFKNNHGKVNRENLMLKLFTDSWYKSIITSVNKSGLVDMLLDQKAPVGVKYVQVNHISQSRGSLRRYYLFYIFLLFPFLFWASGVTSFPGDGIKRLFLRRRRQVV